MNLFEIYFIAAAMATTICAAAVPAPSTLYVFGDSVSDIGAFNNLTMGTMLPSAYWKGRFTSGPVWNEYTAQLLQCSLNNMAVGGSTTDGNYTALLDLFGNSPDRKLASKTNIKKRRIGDRTIEINDINNGLVSKYTNLANPLEAMIQGSHLLNKARRDFRDTPFILPSIDDKISEFSKEHQGSMFSDIHNDLIMLQPGAADLLVKIYNIVVGKLSVSDFVDKLISAVIQESEQLYSVGFRQIVLVDIPGFQHCPAAKLLKIADIISSAVITYNKRLATETLKWAQSKNDLEYFGIVQLGQFMNLTIGSQNIINALGITETIYPCFNGRLLNISLLTGNKFEPGSFAKTSTKSQLCANPGTHYFFDLFHLGERLHRLLGYYASEFVKNLQAGTYFKLDEQVLLDIIKKYNLGTNVFKPARV